MDFQPEILIFSRRITAKGLPEQARLTLHNDGYKLREEGVLRASITMNRSIAAAPDEVETGRPLGL